MFGAFRRPVGAASDVKELEYISALHQTSSVIHTDGTISAQDVLYFLRSRYGLEISSEDAMDIVRGLSGTSRLPLPHIERKVWALGGGGDKDAAAAADGSTSRRDGQQIQDEDDPESSVSRSRQRRRIGHHRCKCLSRIRSKCNCKHNDDDEEREDALAPLEAQLQSMKESKTDTRRGWEFPAMQRQIRRTVPKNVTSLVRYDLVQMMSMLLIPSLLRIERRRFKEVHAPPPRAPIFAEYVNVYNLLWTSSKMAHKILRAPMVLVQRIRQRRLTRIKDSLRPKPDTLLLDVLRILLSSLEERDTPITKLSDFAGTQPEHGSVATGMSATTSGKGRHFPELRETIVTKDLIRKILNCCQQEQAAQDDELIEKMMDLVGGEGSVLDERAFATALTSDVTRWPLECEDDVTSTFFDVYGFGNVECNEYAKLLSPKDLLAPPSRDTAWRIPASVSKTSSEESSHSSSSSHGSFHSVDSEVRDLEAAIKTGFTEMEDSTMTVDSTSRSKGGKTTASTGSGDVSVKTVDGRPLRMGKIPVFKPTTGYIDYSCDSFSSLPLVVFLFCFFSALSVWLVTIVNYIQLGQLSCTESFGCTLWQTVVSWGVLALVLCLGGMLVTLPISLVNQSYLRSFPQALFAIGLLACYLLAPVMEWFLVEYVGIQVSDQYRAMKNSNESQVIRILFYVSGTLTFLEALHCFGAMLIPKRLARRFAILRLLFVPEDILRATNTKRAGTLKLNAVIDRAYRLHVKGHKRTRTRNADHETMLSFLLFGDKNAKSGGLLWSWKNYGYLNKKEGVWLHARLAIGQVGQLLVLVVLTIVWWRGTEAAAVSCENKRDEIEEAGGVGAEWGLYFMPEAWMIYYSFIPGGAVCISALVLLILITYPNTASRVLKYRSGYLPSLHDPLFEKYRKSPAYMYYNTGNMIYAAVGGAVMFFILVAGLLFLLFWPPTQNFMTLLLAWGIGLGITVGLKMILTMFFGKNYWNGLFRNRPAASNVSSLAYECWHLGLGGGVMLSRLCQFLLAAAFWIGRIDSQFLSDDVEVFGYRFDNVPTYYFTEILEHEAHRHPYIERLAAMYLMRLKHGEYFGTDAGAQWRVIFTLTLMPWMVKFSQARVDHNDDDNDSDESKADEANATDWNESMTVPAANGGVVLSGNVPWSPSNEDDDDNKEQSRRKVWWRHSTSSRSLRSGENDNAVGIGQSQRRSHVSWDQFASATSFENDDNGDSALGLGRSERRNGSWDQFASAKSFENVDDGDNSVGLGRSERRNGSWNQFASAKSFENNNDDDDDDGDKSIDLAGDSSERGSWSQFASATFGDSEGGDDDDVHGHHHYLHPSLPGTQFASSTSFGGYSMSNEE